MGTLSLLHSARSLPTHTQVNPRLQALLSCWHQEASLPTKHGGPVLLTVPDSKRALVPPSKSKNTRFPTEGRKAITCYSAGGTRSPIPPSYTEAQCFTLHLPARVTSLLPKSWNPGSSTEWQSATLLVLWGLTPTVHRDLALPTDTAGEPLCPHQRVGNPAPSLRWEMR
jgi:hypothetical protein